MLGWLDRALKWATSNIGGPVLGWVHDLLHGVYGYLHAVFGPAVTAWNNLYKYISLFVNELTSLVNQIVTAFRYLFRTLIPAVYRWAASEIAKAVALANWIYGWAIRELDALGSLAWRWIQDVMTWAWSNIWTPLTHDIAAAWKWITNEGQTLWYYSQHPEKVIPVIANELLSYLEANATDLGKRLTGFMLGLIHNNIGKFVLLLEDIMNAIL
jgi:hypothetical protein